jgi:Flp pilus assembly pilin Flp
MNNLLTKVHVFLKQEKGAETAEWAVIVGLLIVMGTAIYAPGGQIGTAIGGLGAKISAALKAD